MDQDLDLVLKRHADPEGRHDEAWPGAGSHDLRRSDPRARRGWRHDRDPPLPACHPPAGQQVAAMIRIVILSAAFLAVTITLLLIQPDPIPHDADAEPVARAAAAPLDMGAGPGEVARPRARPVTDRPHARPLRALSGEAITALRSGAQAGGPVLLPGELRARIIQAIGEGREDAYIRALLREATEMGARDVPAALTTPQGMLDTVAILEELERRDQARTVMLDDSSLPPRPDSYVVQPGDSLAAIARKFYGRTEAFEQIFQANRDSLGTPDAIRPGQLLILPEY